MKYLLSISILLFSYQLKAFSPEFVERVVNNSSIKVSKNCKDECLAIQAIAGLKSKNFTTFQKYTHGGMTIGEVMCRKHFKAKLKFHVDKLKNEQHFCVFADGSYILTGVIDYLEMQLTSRSR